MIKFDIRWNRKSEYINCCSKKIEKKAFLSYTVGIEKGPCLGQCNRALRNPAGERRFQPGKSRLCALAAQLMLRFANLVGSRCYLLKGAARFHCRCISHTYPPT